MRSYRKHLSGEAAFKSFVPMPLSEDHYADSLDCGIASRIYGKKATLFTNKERI